MRRLCVLIIAVILAACTPAVPLPPNVPATTTVPVPTPAPTLASTPATVREQLDYRLAMKPEFASEVDRFANAPHYQIDLTIAPDRKSYTATQSVYYTNTENVPLKEIYFRLFPNTPSYGGQMQVKSVKVNGAGVTPKFEVNNSALRLDLAEPLPVGQAIEIELDYETQVPAMDVADGYNQFGLHDNVLALPNFYPQIPAYDDKGWHIEQGPGYGDAVFSDTALYRVNLTAPAGEVVATSGVCHLRQDPQPAPLSQTRQCVSGPMRDFMIAMSPDYQVKSDTVDGATINSYYLKGDEGGGTHGLQVARDAMKFYSQRFGPYPFTELDLLETPTTAGGIEYPGLIVVAEGYYQRPDPQEGATAHEVAHQWWYSLIGDDQVNDPWLDEALAQFSTCLYYHDAYGADGLNGCVQQDLQSRYDRVKGTDQDQRADQPVAAYSERQYGAIVYGKAALFFNALYQALGDEKFNQLLQEYYQTYRYGVAYPQDLLALAAKYVGQAKLDELLKAWMTGPG